MGFEATSTVCCAGSTAGGPVRTVDQRGVQRDAPRGHVDVQLDGVIARLAMDIDRTGEAGGLFVGKPIVIGLPTVGRGYEDQFAAAGMVQPVAAALLARQHFGNARLLAKDSGDQFDGPRVAVGHEDVRELVIGQGPGTAAVQIEMLAVGLLADGQQAGLAEHAVGVGHVIDRRDGVFARHEPEQFVAVGLLHCRVEPAQLGVQLADRGRGGGAVGSELLGGIIEVRQVDPEEIGRPRAARQSPPTGRSRPSSGCWPAAPKNAARGNGPVRRATRRKAPSAGCSTTATPCRRDYGPVWACRYNRPPRPTLCMANHTAEVKAPSACANRSQICGRSMQSLGAVHISTCCFCRQ